MSPVQMHSKQVLTMRAWLIGKGYFKALRAMEFAGSFHDGWRKDKITPEFNHQIFIAQYVQTILPSIMEDIREDVLCVCFLHDVPEDYSVGFDEIEARFGTRVAAATKLMTKKYRGQIIPYETYFANLSTCAIASIVKGADRIHNIFTMSSANWTHAKQESYITEVETWFKPMLKAARRQFPEQVSAYENIKTMLNVQIALIRANLAAVLNNQIEPEVAV